MKRIIGVLILIISIFVPLNVFADEVYESVTIYTSFEEKINLDKISKIFINIELKSGKEVDVVLDKKQNYGTILNDLPKEDFNITMGLIEGDYIGKYEVSHVIEYVSESQVVINLTIKEIVRTNTETTNLDEELLNNIFNGNNNSSNDKVTTTTKTTEIKTNAVGEVITTKSKEELIEEEQRIKEEEKEIKIKARNKTYLIILVIVFSIILIVGSFIAVKIINANK